MGGTLSSLFSSLAAAPSSATEPSDLPFNASDWVSLSSMPMWTLALVGVTLVAALVLGHHATRGAQSALRAQLLTLRLLLAGLVLLLLVEPGRLQLATSKVANRVLVVTDTSASMAQEASSGVSRAQVAARAALQLADDLATRDAPFAVEFAQFSNDLSGMSRDQLTALASSSAAPDGERTDLAGVLRSLQKDAASDDTSGQKPLGGVVLLTDGADTEGHDARLPDDVLVALKKMKAPVHVVHTRSTEGFFDRSVHNVIADEFAFVRNKVTLEVVLRHRGVPDDAQGESLPVTLREDGKPILTQTVTLDGERGETKLELTFEPKQAGKHVYAVDIPVHPQEAIALNNQFRFPLEVIRDRIRVLQVVGRPSWDERFVRRLLKENPSVDLISFFILRTQTSVPGAANHELSLIPFPTRELFTEELSTFDVVIFQNFNYGPYSMGRYLPNVHDFVEQSGGGFMMLGGDLSFSEGGYAGTVIEDTLPVRLRHGRGHVDDKRFHPVQTKAGQTHPITDVHAAVGKTRKDPFSSLPKLEGLNLVQGLQPGAEVLLAHPTRRLSTGKAHPVLAVREVGKGRSMALLTDSSWLWSLPHVGNGGRGDAHRKVFANALRWLIRDPELSRVTAKPTKARYDVGEPVVIDIRTFSSTYAPQGKMPVSVDIAPLDGAAKVEHHDVVTDAYGSAQVRIDKPAAGAYRVTVKAQSDGRQVGVDEDAFIVRAAALEKIFAEPQKKALQALTEASKSKLVGPDDITSLTFIDHAVERVHRQQSEPLWNRWQVVLLFVVVAGAEWYLRRRRGLA